MLVKGFSFKPKNLEAYQPIWRFYGTKEVFRYPDGRMKPQPGTWELVAELKVELRRDKVTLPDCELEPTGPGGWRFYNPVLVTRDGQEIWHPDNEIIFPREMIAEFGGDVDVATLLLWNLEQQGVIAPGQLRD